MKKWRKSARGDMYVEAVRLFPVSLKLLRLRGRSHAASMRCPLRLGDIYPSP